MRVRMFRGARFRTGRIMLNWDGEIGRIQIPIEKFTYENARGKLELKSISITLANGSHYEYSQEHFFPDYVLLENEDISFKGNLEFYYPNGDLDGVMMLEFIDHEGKQCVLASYEIGPGPRVYDYSQEIEEFDELNDEEQAKKNNERKKAEQNMSDKKSDIGAFDMKFEQLSFESFIKAGSSQKIVSDSDVKAEVNKANELIATAKAEVQRAYEQVKKIDSEKASLKKELDEAKKDLLVKNGRIEFLERERRELRKKNLELEEKVAKAATPVITQSSMEKHLNEIVDFMEITAKNAGISLSNIYVRTSRKDGKIHVNIRGEISFAKGVNKLSKGCTIKATLYDANGNIEIEGSEYVSSSFAGFNTFDIGWNGGTEASWMTESKIRIFIV